MVVRFFSRSHVHTFSSESNLLSLFLILNCRIASFPDAPRAAGVAAAEAVMKRAIREAIVEHGRRPDGRSVGDTRELTAEARKLEFGR